MSSPSDTPQWRYRSPLGQRRWNDMVGNTHRKPDGAELVDPPDDFAMTPGIRPAKDGQGDFDLLDQLTRSPDVDQWDLDPGLGYSGPNVIEDSRVKRARLPTLEGCYESILYPSEFFVTGRVFSLLGTSSPLGDIVPLAQFPKAGEAMSSIKTFIVIRPGEDSCGVLPIFSYEPPASQRLLPKAAEHSIIFTGSTPPLREPDENVLDPPLRVLLRPDAGSLGSLSRVHFGKIHTVEYDTSAKVKNFGLIDPEHEVALIKRFMDVYTRSLGVGSQAAQLNSVDSISVTASTATVRRDDSASRNAIMLGSTEQQRSFPHDGSQADGSRPAPAPAISSLDALVGLISTVSWGWEGAGYDKAAARDLATQYVFKQLKDLGMTSSVTLPPKTSAPERTMARTVDKAASNSSRSTAGKLSRSLTVLVNTLDEIISQPSSAAGVPNFAWNYLAQCLETANSRKMKDSGTAYQLLADLRQKLHQDAHLYEAGRKAQPVTDAVAREPTDLLSWRVMKEKTLALIRDMAIGSEVPVDHSAVSAASSTAPPELTEYYEAKRDVNLYQDQLDELAIDFEDERMIRSIHAEQGKPESCPDADFEREHLSLREHKLQQLRDAQTRLSAVIEQCRVDGVTIPELRPRPLTEANEVPVPNLQWSASSRHAMSTGSLIGSEDSDGGSQKRHISQWLDQQPNPGDMPRVNETDHYSDFDEARGTVEESETIRLQMETPSVQTKAAGQPD